MEYLSVAQVREMSGLRLVLSRGVPGPWGEALKAVLACKNLDYAVAAQDVGGDNPELVDWTGQASAPVLAWEDETPRCSWLDQLLLLERLAPALPLLGGDTGERALVVGFCHELAGEGGLGWNRRLQLTGMVMESGRAPPFMEVMARRYGYSPQAYAASETAMVSCLGWFTGRLAEQADRGSDYLVGGDLSAADLYLANFIGMLDPLPEAMNPMPAPMRESYSYRTPILADALSPRLLAHRDLVYRRHIKTPLEF